jgi:hypothetical protein
MLRVGDEIWIPCEVRPGPFDDERLIRVESESGEWVGFVNIRWLAQPIEKGRSAVRAVVEDVKGGSFHARIRGHSPSHLLVEGKKDRVRSGSINA